MKAPSIKKEYPNTHSPLLGPEIFYEVKKLVSLKTVVCLSLSHLSFKVRIRLRYFPVFTNQGAFNGYDRIHLRSTKYP